MKDVDRMIAEALDQDERAIFDRIGEEPGLFGSVFGLFSGRLGWVNAVQVAAQFLLFLAGVYAAWHFFEADDVASQLRWGLPSAVLLIVGAILKQAMWPVIQANRLMREIKRLELQVALLGSNPRSN
jgi:hypothetical protein